MMQINQKVIEGVKSKNADFEMLVSKLNDESELTAYELKYNNYKVSLLPKILGAVLVWSGNIFYGRDPSYLKFRAVEVIARIPYHSWTSAAYTLLTLFYTDEKRAIDLARIKLFARHANDNETMHVVVISHIVREEHKRSNTILHSIVPMIFSFFYFWVSYLLFLINKKWSYELNYIFEDHAYHQYNTFVNRYEDKLKNKKIESDFLKFYGRAPANQYEFFRSVRNDELIHRNYSIEEIDRLI